MAGKKVISTYVTPAVAEQVESIAEERHTSTSTVLRGIVIDYLNPRLSPISIAALTQVAKDQGLDDLDAAVEHLVRRGN